LAVDQVAVSNATITMKGPSLEAELSYVGTYTDSCGNVLAHYTYEFTGYQAGVTYEMLLSTTKGDIAVSQVSPGNVTIETDGTQVSWTAEGNEDQVYVTNLATSGEEFRAPGIDQVSPVSIPFDTFPSGHMYTITGFTGNYLRNIPGAAAGSYFTVLDFRQDPVIKQ